MKILYVTTVIGTVNTFLIPHIEYLINHGHEVDVAANITKKPGPDLLKLGCNIYDIKFDRSPVSKNNYQAYKDIKKLVQEGHYKLVHVHTPVAAFLTRLACRKIVNTKVVYTAHGFHFYKDAPLKNWLLYYPLEKLAARWTDIIITINEEDYELVKRRNFKESNSLFHVHGVGVNLDKFSPTSFEVKKELRKKYGFKSDDFILFYAAELNYNKHQDLLINVVNLLKSRIPNIKLLLAGDGNFRGKYEEQVRRLDLQEEICFLGFRKDISNLLRISDVAVASSRREGLPVNVMEAMATGLPLVVTNCRGQRELVRNRENGFVVDINDIEGFADSVEKLYKDKNLRNQFGKKGVELIQNYSIEKVLKELNNVYQAQLGG
ncbi:glycosyltransferase family 1 protein [Clostridium sp. Cult3]|nr:glycosyltransferase family 4 protein [Clostridium sp. Cult3]MCF6460853.1 glycosyltransferase family 1 protein [Clostridium sp. Cult3]